MTTNTTTPTPTVEQLIAEAREQGANNRYLSTTRYGTLLTQLADALERAETFSKSIREVLHEERLKLVDLERERNEARADIVVYKAREQMIDGLREENYRLLQVQMKEQEQLRDVLRLHQRYYREHGMTGHKPDASGFIEPEHGLANAVDAALTCAVDSSEPAPKCVWCGKEYCRDH